MNILVCVKQVPDTTAVKIDPVTNTLIREGVPSILNPFDGFALEMALRLREKAGGTVTLLSMGAGPGCRGAAHLSGCGRRPGVPGFRPGIRRLRYTGHQLYPLLCRPGAGKAAGGKV